MSLVYTKEPRMVSYLDLYGYANDKFKLSKNSQQEVTESTTDVLFAFPDMAPELVDNLLWSMGIDIHHEDGVEEIDCIHRPNCLTGVNEKSSEVYGRTYQGWERTDQEWMSIKRKYNL